MQSCGAYKEELGFRFLAPQWQACLAHTFPAPISTWDEIRKLRVWPKGRLLLALMKTGPLRIPAHVLEAAVLVSLCQARCQGLGFPLLWGWSRERKITN